MGFRRLMRESQQGICDFFDSTHRIDFYVCMGRDNVVENEAIRCLEGVPHRTIIPVFHSGGTVLVSGFDPAMVIDDLYENRLDPGGILVVPRPNLWAREELQVSPLYRVPQALIALSRDRRGVVGYSIDGDIPDPCDQEYSFRVLQKSSDVHAGSVMEYGLGRRHFLSRMIP